VIVFFFLRVLLPRILFIFLQDIPGVWDCSQDLQYSCCYHASCRVCAIFLKRTANMLGQGMEASCKGISASIFCLSTWLLVPGSVLAGLYPGTRAFKPAAVFFLVALFNRRIISLEETNTRTKSAAIPPMIPPICEVVIPLEAIVMAFVFVTAVARKADVAITILPTFGKTPDCAVAGIDSVRVVAIAEVMLLAVFLSIVIVVVSVEVRG